MPVDLLAVDQMLTAVRADAGILRPYALSMVFANAAARAEANQAAGGSDAGGKAWGDSFIGACFRQLGTLGWRLTDAGQSTVTQRSSSFGPEVTTLADVLASAGGDGVQDVLDAIRAAVGAGAADPGSSAGGGNPLLAFWWSSVMSADWLLCGLGRVSGDAGGPALALDVVQIDLASLRLPAKGLFGTAEPFKPEDPGGLFVEIAARSVKVVARRTVRASLDTSVFAAKKGAIEARLGDKFADHYVLSSGGQL